MPGMPFKLFALSGSQELANEVAGRLGISLGSLFTTRFSDGEVYARFDETIRGETVVLLAQINLPYHNLFELLVAADAARRSSAREVVAVLPYLPHSRQERRDGERTAVTSRLMAETIELAGVDRVLTLDLHSMSIEGFFKIPIDHLQMSAEFVKDIREQYGDEPVSIELSIVDTASGEPALKRQIQDLHQQLLGSCCLARLCSLLVTAWYL